MRVALERLDLRGLNFTSAGHPPHYQVTVREGEGVRGELVRDATQLSLRELGADKLVLDALRLVFGSLLIDSQRESAIEQLQGELRSSLALLELTLKAHAVRAQPLSIEVGQLTLGADAELLGVALRVGDDGGSISVEQLSLRNFQARSGEFGGASAALSAQRFELGWGLELRVSAARLEVPELKLDYTQRIKLILSELTCTDLTLRGPRLLLGGLHIKRARYDQSLEVADERAVEGPTATPPSAPSAPARASQPASRKAFDLDLLDGLSGHLQVDVQVDITIPIFGTRRAKHELRLSVEEGSVDYRELESNLAPLENALLDFSVRGSELVLEQGIPLLPTRGFGKPILRWHLSPRDRELAERDRVRLALFPEYHLAGSRAERDDDEAPSKFALRKLGLNILDFSLALSPVSVPGIALRGVSIERLSARGSIQHHISDVDPEGVVTGDMRGLALSVDALRVGTRALALQKLQVLRVPRWVMRFAGLTPTAVGMELEDIMLIQLSIS